MAEIPQRVTPGSAANPRLGRVLREALWILLLAAGLYLALALGSYDKGDPGPFYSGSGAPVVNRGGVLGAFAADAMLYLFGLSAWWWVALAAVGILRLYGRVEAWEILNRRTLAACLAGFAFVLASSAALEALRLHSLGVALPGAPGGVIGDLLSRFVLAAFGFTGGTLILIATLAAAISVFTGLSWIRASEKLGAGVERLFALGRARIEARRDREAGQLAAQVREEKVEEAKKVFEEHEPIRIEMPMLEVDRKSVV